MTFQNIANTVPVNPAQLCTCFRCQTSSVSTGNTWTLYYPPLQPTPPKSSLPYELAYLAARKFIGIQDPETQAALREFLEEAGELIDSTP